MVDQNFLGQNLKQNTLQALYDFTRRFSGRVGYRYTNRKIAQFARLSTPPKSIFPAARPELRPTIIWLRAATALFPPRPRPTCFRQIARFRPTARLSRPARSRAAIRRATIYDINEQAALLGFTARPIDSLRITGDFEFGYNDFAFTRTSPRQMQSYKIHANYTPRPWLNLDGSVDIHENRDNVYQVNNLEHGRTYGFVTVFSPNAKYSVDIGYNYTNIYSQALVCFAASGTGVPTYPVCPIAGSPVAQGATSFYNSNQHFAYFDVMWKPIKRVSTTLGYSGTFVGGNTLFLNPLQPAGTLAFNYTKPYAAFQFDLYKGFSYKTAWNYYGYDEKGPERDFRAYSHSAAGLQWQHGDVLRFVRFLDI